MARHVLTCGGVIGLLAAIFLSFSTCAAIFPSEMISAHITVKTDLRQPWWQQALEMPDYSSDSLNSQDTGNTLASIFTPLPNSTASRDTELNDGLDATTGYLKEQQLPPCCRHKLAKEEQQQTSATALTSNCLDFHQRTNQTKPQYDWDGTILDVITDNDAEKTANVALSCMSSEQTTIGSLPCCLTLLPAS